MDFTVTKLHLYRHLGGRSGRCDRSGGSDAVRGWEVAAVFAFGGSLVSGVSEVSVGTEMPAAPASPTTPVVSM